MTIEELQQSLQTVRALYENEKEHVDWLIRSNRALTDILHDTKTAKDAAEGRLAALEAERDSLHRLWKALHDGLHRLP